VLRGLMAMLAGGADCVSDLASLRNQPELLVQVVSSPDRLAHPGRGPPADPRGISGAVAGAGQGPRATW
jgi:hypothetical protein